LGGKATKGLEQIAKISLRRTFVLIMITLFSNCKCVQLEIWVLFFPSKSMGVRRFEDIKEVNRICKSKMDRQHNGQKKKDKKTNNDL